MEYEFEIIGVNSECYKVNVCVKDSSNNTIFKDVLEAKYDESMDMVLLNLHYINRVIQNNNIRISLVSNLKKYIKQVRKNI